MTEGRAMLLELLQRTRGYLVAARCRVDPSAVSRWASGERTPGPEARRLLAGPSRYGIPAEAWDRELAAGSVPARRSVWLE